MNINLETVGQIIAALVILDNALDAVLELFGNTKWETRLTIIARWLRTIEQNLPKGPIPPAAAVLAIFLAVGWPSVARSDTGYTSVSDILQSVNVSTDISKLQGKAIDAGLWFNGKDKVLDFSYTYAPLGHMNIGTWGQWEYVDVGYASPDVLLAGSGFGVNIGQVLKKWDITLPTTYQNIANDLVVGVQYDLGLEQIGGKNKLTGGPGFVYAQVGF